MALSLTFNRATDQVLFGGNSCVKEVILNKPQKLNILNHEMLCLITKKLISYENDPSVKLVIFKGNGKAFCAGDDVRAVIASTLIGYWTYAACYYRKLFTLVHLTATYKKPLVCLIDGVVMGAGAGISMNSSFRVVTEKTMFSMPEVSIGLHPDVGASYFLSWLPCYFGEYIGLSGAQLDGAEMVACGLATHFVPSKRLNELENALQGIATSDVSVIQSLIEKFSETPYLNKHSPFLRLETINKCFSKGTVEEIIESLETIENEGEKWITDALNYMRSSSPISLKLFLRSVREGRVQNIEQCLTREYIITSHMGIRTVSNDFYEGARAKLFDNDKPKWEPSKLELVTEEMVDQYFKKVEDEDWVCLQLPNRSKLQSKL